MIKILSDTSRIVYAMCKCILFPESSVLVTFKDEEETNNAFKIAMKLCSKDVRKEILKINKTNIEFKNKSNLTLDYSKPKVEPEYIRGHRSKLPLLYYDDFHIDNDMLEEVLKPYIKERNIKQ